MVLNGLAARLAFLPITSVGLAVIVSVYAAGSVPGEFLPGAQAAFLTSATMAALAAVAGVAALARRRATPLAA
ncbi:hypothetical protein [Nocardioides dilutus]